MNILREIGKGLKKVGKIAGSGAPLIATLAGGPQAGKLVSMLTRGTNTNSLEDAIQTIENHPNPDILLAEIEAENKVKLQELNANLEVTKNAQNMHIENSRNSDSLVRRAPIYQAFFVNLSWLVSSCFIYYLASKGGVAIDTDLRALIFMGYGAQTTETARINHFFFGSSTGSKDKSESLSTFAK
ncbi:MAG: hypothetical protein KC646_10080 [Candidatus Cloacimonetes bacterium]|nr:hypothetical protein [Candidatus Cloacimonadota bacterium]